MCKSTAGYLSRRFTRIGLSCCLCLAFLSGAGRVTLTLKDPPADFPYQETGQSLSPVPGAVIVNGIFNAPFFGVSDTGKIRLQADGKPVSLLIETSTLYREFDEINSLRLAFTARPGQALLLEWGPDIVAANILVEKISVPPALRSRHQTFAWQEAGESGFARLQVIVDDAADYYFLWYLLPMALIFLLLFIRKKSAA